MDQADYDNDFQSTNEGTIGDEEERLDLERYSSFQVESSPSRRYRFKAKHNPNPTDIIYREKDSRAAPRKGIEPKAFLTIGEPKQETAEVVQPRTQKPGTPSNRRQITASAKSFNRRLNSGYRVYSSNRHQNLSRAGGHYSGWSSPSQPLGYTPLPISLPYAAPTRQNTYISQPFKQTVPNYQQHAKDRCTSPSEELKQATMQATMEVGKIINNSRAKSGLVEVHKNKLLKAHLKPLNTVDMQGPRIEACKGVRPAESAVGPSVLKQRQQQQLDDLIEKSAAIKRMPTGSKLRNTAATYPNSRSAGTKENSSSRNGSANKRIPTPSPYASNSELHTELVDTPAEQLETNERSSVKSSPRTEGGTPQKTPRNRSVSAVTVRKKENITPPVLMEQESTPTGVTFITDQPEELNPNKPPKPKSKPAAGCKPFTDGNVTNYDDANGGAGPGHPDHRKIFVAERTQTATSQASSKQGSKPHSASSQRANKCSKLNESIPAWTKINQSNSTTLPTNQSNHQKREASAKSQTGDNCTGTFITAGFLTLDSMINEARQEITDYADLIDDNDFDFESSPKPPDEHDLIQNDRTVTFGDNQYYNPSPRESGIFLSDDECTQMVFVQPETEQESRETTENNNDSKFMEAAAQSSVTGEPGFISEYLTHKSYERPEIYIPPKIFEQNDVIISPRISPAPSLDDDPIEIDREYNTAHDMDVFDQNKSFLEQVTDLLDSPRKEERTKNDSAPVNKSVTVEGLTKPICSRKDNQVSPLSSQPPMCFRINALCTPGYFYYFTYDADLIETRFNTLLKTVKRKQWALLFGFQLAFNKFIGDEEDTEGFATLDINPHSSVEGGVYKITAEQLAILDSLHRYPEHFQRIVLPIWICNSTHPEDVGVAQYCVPAVTYILRDDENTMSCRAEFNLKQCIKGSSQFTPNYKSSLISQLVC